MVKNIYMIGPVETGNTCEIVTDLLECDLKQVNEIKLYIKSEGGLLGDCFAIIDLLLYIKKLHNIKITTYGMGEISSAGFFIFIVGDKKILFPNCRVFVHEHVVSDDNSTYNEKLKADLTEGKEVYNKYVKYTSKMLNITIKKAKELLSKNAFLTNKELKEFKIK